VGDEEKLNFGFASVEQATSAATPLSIVAPASAVEGRGTPVYGGSPPPDRGAPPPRRAMQFAGIGTPPWGSGREASAPHLTLVFFAVFTALPAKRFALRKRNLDARRFGRASAGAGKAAMGSE
jgi:hypothetical protein